MQEIIKNLFFCFVWLSTQSYAMEKQPFLSMSADRESPCSTGILWIKNQQRDVHGNTPLHNAVACMANAKDIDLLLCNGADPEQRNVQGLTPFDMAITVTLQYALTHDIVFPLSIKHVFPHDIAVKYGITTQQGFEKHGMFFFPQQGSYNNPFQFLENTPQDWYQLLNNASALQSAEHSLARLFGAARAIKNKHNKVSLSSCGITKNEHGYFVKHIALKDLEPFFGKDVVEDIDMHLMSRCIECLSLVEQNDVGGVAKQIKRYPFVTQYDPIVAWGMLKTAIQHHYNQCLELLLRTDINLTIFQHAQCGDDLLLLHQAIAHNNLRAITLLIQYGFSYCKRDKNGRTAIEYAIDNQRHDSVEWFNNVIGEKLSQALVHDDWDLFLSVLPHMPDINKPCLSNGWTVLHKAVATKRFDIEKYISMLLVAKANPNACGLDGVKPPLFYALNKQYQVCLMLLDAGARVNSSSNGEIGPLECAVCRNDTKAVTLLLDYGGLVTKDIINSALDDDMRRLLQKKYDTQFCCVCLQNPPGMVDISCKSRHKGDFICKPCLSLTQDLCPLCQKI